MMKSMVEHSKARGTWLPAGISLLPLAAGLSLWTNAAFPSLGLRPVVYAAALYALSLLFACLYAFRFGKLILPIGTAAALAVTVIRRSSFLILFNDFFVALQRVTGHISLPADDTGTHIWAVRAVMLLGGTLILSITAYSGSPLWMLPILTPLLEGAFSSIVPLGWGAVLMGAGILLLQRKRPHLRAVAARCGVLVLCMLLAAGVGFGLRNMPQDGARKAIQSLYHHIRYDHRADAMPEGRLSKLKPFEPDDTPALKVTTEKRASLYLRGTIYEVYNGSDWTKLPAEKRADYGELFYWLHDNRFYGQSQIGFASALCAKDEPYRMTIETLSACGAHGYLPYGVQSIPHPDETLIGDAVIPRGDGEILCRKDDLQTLYTLPQMLDTANDAEYTALEEAYAEYVRRMDLQMPQETHDALYPLLGIPDSSRTLSQIETLVRDTLDKSLEYDTSAGFPDGKGDFLARTLQNGRGYSVHYATAAVLMLRYFGVPARYVEGYYLPESEAKEENILTKANAHAWAELYLNGVGFVPFEVTPGYWTQKTPEPDGRHKASHDSVVPQPVPTPSPSPSTPIEPQSADTAAPRFEWLFFLLIPAAAALYVFIGRMRLRRALDRIAKSDDRAAVRALYAYGEKLCTICPGKPHGKAKAYDLYLQARYSDHNMTDEHRSIMMHYVRAVCRRCQKKLPWYKKLYCRWIRFYY